MRRIGVVTSARSDFSILTPLLEAIEESSRLNLELVVTGMHLSEEFGGTIREIEREGFEPVARVESLGSRDDPAGVAHSMGRGVAGFAELFEDWRPDLLVVLGDRYDMLPAAIAALPHRIPVAHLHGGERSEGSIDESIRHSLTKLSHLHFVATPEYGARVEQLGEEPWRVHVSGSPAIDSIETTSRLSSIEFQQAFGLRPDSRFLLVTLHPQTLGSGEVRSHVGELLGALDEIGLPCLFTAPNGDAGGRAIRAELELFCRDRPRSRSVPNAGRRGYYSLMQSAAAMVGNSSSGLLEAPTLGLPVVNVGDRQRGRIRAANVIDCELTCESVSSAIRDALSPEFRAGLQGLVNPYGDGHASARIVEVLCQVPLDQRLLTKRFCDVPKRGEARPAARAAA